MHWDAQMEVRWGGGGGSGFDKYRVVTHIPYTKTF